MIFANPKVFLGPEGDPAGIRELDNPVMALQKIFDKGYCYIINPHGRLGLQQHQYLDKVTSDKSCVMQGPGDINLLLDMALKHKAYTLWGLHPFVARSDHPLEPVVIPDEGLLENLAGWIVAGSRVEESARELLNYLAGDEAKERIESFRLKGFENVQPWYPPIRNNPGRSRN